MNIKPPTVKLKIANTFPKPYRMSMGYRSVFLLVIVLFLDFHTGHSQGLLGSGNTDRIEGKFKFIPLPFVDYNRAVGYSIGAIPMVMMNLSEKDTISPSSTVGLIGVYTENKSWFGMGFGRFYLDEDRWRASIAGGVGEFNFQFYISEPLNQWFKYNTSADFFYFGLQRRIIPKLYGGVRYIYTTFNTSTELFPITNNTSLHGVGIDGSYDKRSSVAYARSGFLIETDFTHYPKAFNGSNESSQVTLSYNHYFSLRNDTDVLAARFYSGFAIGNDVFNQQFVVGNTDIRGYSFGEFRGNTLIAAQGEYRWNFHERIGVVGFAGIATVFGGINSQDDGRILPGIGTGFRYVFLKETHSTIGFDVAVGDGDWGFYFRLSEAF